MSSSFKQEEYINYISNLPLNPSPEAFGLHDNAEITNAQEETRVLMETILSIQARSSGGVGKSREEVIDEIATFIQGKTPEIFDEEKILNEYPTSYDESMNTVLYQEVFK